MEQEGPIWRPTLRIASGSSQWLMRDGRGKPRLWCVQRRALGVAACSHPAPTAELRANGRNIRACCRQAFSKQDEWRVSVVAGPGLVLPLQEQGGHSCHYTSPHAPSSASCTVRTSSRTPHCIPLSTRDHRKRNCRPLRRSVLSTAIPSLLLGHPSRRPSAKSKVTGPVTAGAATTGAITLDVTL